MLPWNDPHSGRELSPLAEACSIADRCDHRGCRHRSDARDFHQTLARLVLASRFLDCRIGFLNAQGRLVQ
jgi:hypothetical protein